MKGEKQSLLPKQPSTGMTRLPSTGENKSFYFMAKTKSHASDSGNKEASKPKVELTARPKASYDAVNPNGSTHVETPATAPEASWWSQFFNNGYQRIDNSRHTAKPRKVPVKVEPKVYFANERTFLSWLHMSVTLASISIAIVAFAEANEWSQIYGMLLLPVAIAFTAYALYMYTKRAAMIRRKDPGPYEDKVGPLVLATLLGSAIFVNFAVKLYSYTRR